MFDYETITKTANENAARINSAAVEFTRNLLDSTQKIVSKSTEAVTANPALAMAREWADLYQEQAKAFATVFTTKSK